MNSLLLQYAVSMCVASRRVLKFVEILQQDGATLSYFFKKLKSSVMIILAHDQ